MLKNLKIPHKRSVLSFKILILNWGLSKSYLKFTNFVFMLLVSQFKFLNCFLEMVNLINIRLKHRFSSRLIEILLQIVNFIVSYLSFLFQPSVLINKNIQLLFKVRLVWIDVILRILSNFQSLFKFQNSNICRFKLSTSLLLRPRCLNFLNDIVFVHQLAS